jgi:glycosyltransferase involved in cell wall biosynthesis
VLRVALITVGDPGRLSGGSLYQRHVAERAGNAGAAVTMWPLPDAPLRIQRRAAPRILADATRHADVLVVESLAAAGVAGAVDALEVPAVALVHQAPGGSPRASRRRRLDQRTYRSCAGVVATGPGLALELKALGVDVSDVVVPGTDPAPEVPAVGGMRRGRRIALLCVANRSPSKHVADLLVAMGSVPSATLHLVGDPRLDTRHGRATARAAQRLGDAVVVHGIRQPEAVAGLRAGADVFVLPSTEESYGMAWAEAMAAGLPVVGYRAAHLPNLVADGVEGLLVTPGDVGRLARAIEALAEDEALRRRLGAGARKRAQAFPTWETTTGRFVAVLRAVAAQPSPR